MGKRKKSTKPAAEEITKMLADELKPELDREESLGFDFFGLLLNEPEQYPDPEDEMYEEASQDPKWQCVWTVCETKVDNDTYRIFFDPGLNLFGLGIQTANSGLLCLGYYNSSAMALSAI